MRCYEFNQPVDNLPETLTHLTFGYEFNQKVNKLPKNITHLIFGYNFRQSINNLPESLIYLDLGSTLKNNIIIPKKLKELVIFHKNTLINNLPDNIEKIYVVFNLKNKTNNYVSNLPLSIKEIIIEKEKYKKFIKIPFNAILTIKNF